MKTKLGFWLLAGALLQDVVNWDNDLLCSNANITDDLALYHLKTNPNCREMFQELPENVDELVEAYQFKKPKTEKAPPQRYRKRKKATKVEDQQGSGIKNK